MNNAFHELTKQLRACKTERKLLTVATYITNNAAHLRLDEWDLHKLEQVGMQVLDSIQRDGKGMISNSKIGMKKYEDD